MLGDFHWYIMNKQKIWHLTQNLIILCVFQYLIMFSLLYSILFLANICMHISSEITISINVQSIVYWYVTYISVVLEFKKMGWLWFETITGVDGKLENAKRMACVSLAFFFELGIRGRRGPQLTTHIYIYIYIYI